MMEEQIDDYLMGRMSEEDGKTFQQQMAKNKELAKAVEIREQTINALNVVYNEELKERIKQHDLAMDKPKFWNPFRVIAASISLIFVSTLIYFQLPKSSKTESFDFFEAGIPNRMSTNNTLSLMQNGMNAFKLEEYTESQLIFEELLAKRPYNDTINYHLGVVHYRLGNYDDAKSAFEKVIALNSPEYTERSEFRLALTFLELETKEPAKIILDAIRSNPQHELNEDAIEVLNTFFDK